MVMKLLKKPSAKKNKNPVHENPNAPHTTVPAEDSAGSQQIVGPKVSKKWLGSILLIIVIGVAAIMVVDKNKDNTVFTIDGKSYSNQQVSDLTAFPRSAGLAPEDAARQAFELLRSVKAAEKSGVKPDPKLFESAKKELLTALKLQNSKDKNSLAWVDLQAQVNAIEQYIGDTVVPGYKGYAFDFYFGQHIQHGPDSKITGLNDPELIRQDKEYAKKQADFYYQGIKGKTMSPEQALRLIYSDPKLTKLPGGGGTTSKKFGSSNTLDWETEVRNKSAIDYIKSQTQPGLSDVKTGRAAASINQEEKDYPEIYYYFVQLDAIPEVKAVSQADFAKAKDQINAKYKGLNK